MGAQFAMCRVGDVSLADVRVSEIVIADWFFENVASAFDSGNRAVLTALDPCPEGDSPGRIRAWMR